MKLLQKLPPDVLLVVLLMLHLGYGTILYCASGQIFCEMVNNLFTLGIVSK